MRGATFPPSTVRVTQDERQNDKDVHIFIGTLAAPGTCWAECVSTIPRNKNASWGLCSRMPTMPDEVW